MSAFSLRSAAWSPYERWRPWRNELGERADGVTSEALPPTESAQDQAHTVHP